MNEFSGRFLSPRVFSAYFTPFSKSRRFLTLINAFLCLRRKKEWDGKKFIMKYSLLDSNDAARARVRLKTINFLLNTFHRYKVIIRTLKLFANSARDHF